MDNNQVLRGGGGRLGNAFDISESQRHPIIIPKSHGLNLLVRYTHFMNGHASNSLMIRFLIEYCWLPGIRNIIKRCVQASPTCIRWKAKTIQPEMAQLPMESINPSDTFEKVS